MTAKTSGLVSIILLSYKNLNGVYETLDSIFMQDYPSIEIILSDDGTPEYDNEKNNIKEYIDNNKESNIKSVIFDHSAENQGTVKNANGGIKKSSGEYIKLLASEDVFASSTAISDYVDFIEKEGSLVIFGKIRGITAAGKYVDELLACESDYELLGSFGLKRQRDRLFARNYLPAPAAFFKREVFDKCGFFDEDIRLIEDYPYWIKLTKHRILFKYMDRVTVNCRMSGVSSSGNYSEMFMKDMFVIYNKYIFPYDKRFKKFQGIYNKLKKDGLQFYMEKARLQKYSAGKKLWVCLRYSPFFVYTKLQNKQIEKKNNKILRNTEKSDDIKMIAGDDFRRLQLLELEMLVEFDRVCRENNINYAIVCGTLLGAVRHKGFIPWDDDADIAMLREDYEKFKSVADQMDQSICFFQDHDTDPEYRWGYGKLRKTGTTYIRIGQKHLKCKTGVYVDVMPMDDIPKSYVGQVLNDLHCFILRKLLWSEVGKLDKSTSVLTRGLYRLLSHISPKWIFSRIDKMARKSNSSSDNLVRVLMLPSGAKERKQQKYSDEKIKRNEMYGVPKSWYVDTKDYEFEGHMFRGIGDYDTYLKSRYGNYMELPPEEKRVGKAPVCEYDF